MKSKTEMINHYAIDQLSSAIRAFRPDIVSIFLNSNIHEDIHSSIHELSSPIISLTEYDGDNEKTIKDIIEIINILDEKEISFSENFCELVLSNTKILPIFKAFYANYTQHFRNLETPPESDPNYLPIAMAASKGHADVVKFLLEQDHKFPDNPELLSSYFCDDNEALAAVVAPYLDADTVKHLPVYEITSKKEFSTINAMYSSPIRDRFNENDIIASAYLHNNINLLMFLRYVGIDIKCTFGDKPIQRFKKIDYLTLSANEEIFTHIVKNDMALRDCYDISTGALVIALKNNFHDASCFISDHLAILSTKKRDFDLLMDDMYRDKALDCLFYELLSTSEQTHPSVINSLCSVINIKSAETKADISKNLIEAINGILNKKSFTMFLILGDASLDDIRSINSNAITHLNELDICINELFVSRLIFILHSYCGIQYDPSSNNKALFNLVDTLKVFNAHTNFNVFNHLDNNSPSKHPTPKKMLQHLRGKNTLQRSIALIRTVVADDNFKSDLLNAVEPIRNGTLSPDFSILSNLWLMSPLDMLEHPDIALTKSATKKIVKALI